MNILVDHTINLPTVICRNFSQHRLFIFFALAKNSQACTAGRTTHFRGIVGFVRELDALAIDLNEAPGTI